MRQFQELWSSTRALTQLPIFHPDPKIQFLYLQLNMQNPMQILKEPSHKTRKKKHRHKHRLILCSYPKKIKQIKPQYSQQIRTFYGPHKSTQSTKYGPPYILLKLILTLFSYLFTYRSTKGSNYSTVKSKASGSLPILKKMTGYKTRLHALPLH